MLTTIKLFKKWLTAIASVLAFLIFAFVSLPIIMDSNSVQKVLASLIADILRKGVYLTPENMFLKGVSPDRVTFSVFPFPSIELSDVKLTSSPFQNSTIEKVFVSFSPDSFIKKKILIRGITLQNPVIHSSSSLLSIQFKGDNLFDYFQQEQKDFFIKINNLTSDTFKKTDIMILLDPSKKSISSDITTHDLALHDLLRISTNNTLSIKTDKAVKEDETIKADKSIKIDKLICRVAVKENEFTIRLNNIAIPPFSSDFSIEFSHGTNGKNGRGTSLLFSGKDVNIDALRPLVMKLIPDNLIAEKIFAILYGGMVKNIEVLFHRDSSSCFEINQPLRKLFNPLEMTIRGDVKNGIINIPTTHLTATETDAMVTVKNGILHTRILKGYINKSEVNSGTLDVNLIHPDHSFSGEFDISADLAHLNRVLQELLPETPVSREIALLRDIEGGARGTLNLEGSKKHQRPSVSVTARDIKLTAIYPRLPRQFSINSGEFNYSDKNKIISIDKFNGNIGLSTFSNFAASLTLDKNHLLKINYRSANNVFNTRGILAGTTAIVIEEFLPWITSLVRFPVLSLLTHSTGNIDLTEIAFKGELRNPETWDYLFEGTFDSITLRQKDDRNNIRDELSDIKATFLLSPSITRISFGNARIKETTLISALIFELTKNGLINQGVSNNISMLSDIKTPFSLRDVYFQQKKTRDNSISERDNKAKKDEEIDFDKGKTGEKKLSDITTDIRGLLIFNDNLHLSLTGEKNSHAETELYNINLFENGIENAAISYRINQSRKDQFNSTLSAKKNPQILFKGIINTKNIEAILNPLSETYKSLISLTDGREIAIESNQENQYTITTKELDLNFILEKQRQMKLPLPLKSYSAKKESKWKSSEEEPTPIILTLNSDRFTHKKITIAPFSARIVINGMDKKITIDNMKMCNIKGSTEINLRKELTEFSITLDDDNKNIEPVIDCFYHGDKLMEGNYSLKAFLYARGTTDNALRRTLINGTGKTPGNDIDNNTENADITYINMDSLRKSLKHNLTGTIRMTSDGGRIFRLTLLSRILSLLNISKLMEGKFPDIEQNGFAFNYINIVADVEKSRILLKRAVINGLDMTLLFVGWIDMVSREIDLTCMVAPFKTADRIIGKIPVINTMLNGRLISVPVKATGTLSNPEVTVLEPSEVGKSLINTMRDILTTPFKLIDNLQSGMTE